MVVYAQAEREAQLEQRRSEERGKRYHGHRAEALNEEVYLAQLHKRAILLNEEFQDAVKEVVLQHAVAAESVHADGVESGWQVQGPMETASTAYVPDVDGLPVTKASASIVMAKSAPAALNSASRAPSGSSDVTHWGNAASLQSPSWTFDNRLQPTPSASSATSSLMPWKRLSRVRSDLASRTQSSGFPIHRCPSVISSEGFHGTHIVCKFKDRSAVVEVLTAPVKTVARMREKVLEYSAEASTSKGSSPGSGYPHTAQIVDPVRSSIVCDGPAQILEVFRWFSQGVSICRVKNRFSFDKGELLGGFLPLPPF